MDGDRFDAMAKTLAGIGSRRAALRTLAASGLAAGLTPLGFEVAAACKKSGRTCDKNNDCCNKQCKGGRKGKKGKCQCARVGRRCSSFADFNDCCGSSMSCLGPSGDTRCCKRNDATCGRTRDCCGDEDCEAAPGGRKRCCRGEGEVCTFGFSTRTCCNGLVCDVDDTLTCVKLGIGG